ncbi:hypothetical protein JCM8208_007701 [Rhodotorula glutinis]
MSSSTAPASLPVNPPAAPAYAPTSPPLPDELWLKILADLDYSSLRKAGQLCKKLEGFLKDPAFDDALFRTPPPQELIVGEEVDIHPLLHATYCIFEGDDAPLWEGTTSGRRARTASDYAAVNEYATNPACRRMYVDVNCSKHITVIANGGIKVRDVLTSLGRFWASKLPRRIAREIAEEEGFEEEGWMGMDWTWRVTLGEYDSWTGWMEAEVEMVKGGPAVVLIANDFGAS